MSKPALGDNLILDRFWARRGANVEYEHPHGFLIEPYSHYGVQLNPKVIRLRDVPPASWVIALGEPGIGKSTTLRHEYEQRRADGHPTHWVDLHSIGTPEELNRYLFNSPQIADWIGSESGLYLFLDSFDECRMRIGTLTAVIEREIANWPTQRLHLFIGCRTADWPHSLEAVLSSTPGKHEIAVVQLLPLSAEHVLAAARAAQIDDPYAFLAAVRSAGVGPLAAKPLILDFLLREYARSGALPTRQEETYRRGCLLLCEESERRRDVDLLPLLEPDERLAVASRLAAVSMFANRDAFWLGPISEDFPSGDLAINAVYHSSVTTPHGNSIDLNRELVKDTVSTGLFISRGENRLGWAHQTFAEYLAARSLQDPAISLAKIKQLLYHEDGRVASQLRETAAWLAIMRRDVFQELSFTDPQILVTSDAGVASESDRRDWTESLIIGAKRGEVSVRRLHDPDSLLTNLKHETIDAQVRSVLSDHASGFDVCWLAIHIAEACELHSVQLELLNISLSGSVDLQLRISAAFALIAVGSGDTVQQLRPLLHDPNDKRQQLLGTALIGLWPHHLEAMKLFSYLSAPEEPNLHGSYRMFLNSHFVPGLSDADISTALSWLISVTDDNRHLYSLGILTEQLVRRACNLLDDAEISRLLAKLIARALTSHNGLRSRLWDAERQLEEEAPLADRIGLIPLVLDELSGDAEQNAAELWYERYLQDDDIPQIAQSLLNSTDRSVKEQYALVLACRLRKQEPPFLNDVLEVYVEGDDVTRELLAPFFAPVEWPSPRAEKLKVEYERQLTFWNEYEKRHRERKPQQQYDWDEPIKECLAEWEKDDLNAWHQIIWTLAIMSDGDHIIGGHQSEPNLTKLPGWQGINEEIQDRIISVAHQYIERYEPQPQRWIGTDRYVPGDWAGYQALELVWRLRRQLFEQIPASLLVKWTPVIAAYPVIALSESEQRNILEFVEPISPASIAETIGRLLETGNDDHRLISIIDRIELCSSRDLHETLLVNLDKHSASAPVFNANLKWLLTHQNTEAIAKATALATSSETELETRIAAGRCLLTLVPGGAWQDIGPVFRADVEFGKSLAHSLAWVDDFARMLGANLSAKALGELYIWACQQFPHDTDPPLPNGLVSPEQNIVTWRDALLSALAAQATSEACETLAEVAAALPHLPWLNATRLECEEKLRRFTWVTKDSTGVIQLLNSLEGDVRMAQAGKRATKLFIVHGHDLDTMREVVHYLTRTLDFPNPIILSEEPSGGRTIIEKFEDHAGEAQGAIVILTPDDMVANVESDTRRARQNVIFELGYFYARFVRRSGRVIMLYKGALEVPSDISGVLYVDISKGVEAAGEQIRRELEWAF